MSQAYLDAVGIERARRPARPATSIPGPPSCRSNSWTRPGSRRRCCRCRRPASTWRRRRETARARARVQRGAGERWCAIIRSASACWRSCRCPTSTRASRDRARLRGARGRRRGDDEQLRRRIHRQRRILAGVRGARPPQGRGVLPSDLAAQFSRLSRRVAVDHGVSLRHRPRHHEHALLRHAGEIPATCA